MNFVELGSFEAFRGHLPWPWITIDGRRESFAFPSSARRVETRRLAEGKLAGGPTFTLPEDLGVPTGRATAAAEGAHLGPLGLRGFSLDGIGERLALVGNAHGQSVLVTVGVGGEAVRSPLEGLVGHGFVAQAVAFDRTAARIWISAESGAETAIVLVDALTHALLGVVRSPPFPPPSFHELYIHPVDDAVLLLSACGQDGTFARVSGFADGPPVAIPTHLDGGSVPAGFVGFSADAARVHLVEADELRTHAWPGLQELSSVELSDDFVSSYAGVVLGHRILVDGRDGEDDADAVMLFDRSALRGTRVPPPVPRGMWVGRLGTDALVTVEAKGDPAVGRVVRFPEQRN